MEYDFFQMLASVFLQASHFLSRIFNDFFKYFDRYFNSDTPNVGYEDRNRLWMIHTNFIFEMSPKKKDLVMLKSVTHIWDTFIIFDEHNKT